MKDIFTMVMPQIEMQKQMEEEVAYFIDNFHDDPRFLSAWGHAYFCKDDGAPLKFELNTPHEHVCTICGKTYKGFLYDGCHTTMLRNLSAVTCLKCAVLFRLTNDKKYIGFIKNIIGFYADNYESFAVHAKQTITDDSTLDVGGAGKIMPQGLNESIFLIRMLSSMEIVRNELDEKFLTDVREKLFYPAVKLLYPQKMHIHNIPCWINSFLGMTGLFFNNKDLIEEVTFRPFNINEQIAKGVTDAGFWYEGSIHYNFFTLEGIMSLLIFCKNFELKMPEQTLAKIKNMLFAAYKYAFDNMSFPNPSDGWPNVGLKTYLHVYYMGYAVFGEDILPLIKAIECSEQPRQRVPLSEPYFYNNIIPIERVMYGPKSDVKEMNISAPEKRTSLNLESYNCAVLRNEHFNVFLKYGHQTKSHAHPDKMSVEVLVDGKSFTRDLSNSGYTSDLCNKWHRRNISHSTCMVNKTECNVDKPGKLISFNENSVIAEAEVQPGVTFRRSIHLHNKQMTDTFAVKCNKQSQIDWFYHFNQQIDRTSLDLHNVGKIDGYDYFFDVHSISHKGYILFSTPVGEVNIAVDNDSMCYIGKTYNNPANTMRDTLLIIKSSTSANIIMKVDSK